MQLADINLLDLDRCAERAPHEELALLRRDAPVHWHPEQDGRGFWVIAKHADVVACSRDFHTFSSEARLGGPVFIEDSAIDAELFAEAFGSVMFMMDPPRHTRYRKLVQRAFTPKAVARMEDQIRSKARVLIDRARGAGECDFVADLAAVLPLEVIADLIGAPPDDRADVFEWTNTMTPNEDPDIRTTEEAALQAQLAMFSYVSSLRERRTADPQDDILSSLIAARVDGEALSEFEIDAFFGLLATAGNETTRNAISHGLHALATHPGQLASLRERRELMPTAVEEMLRWASPVSFFRRNVTRDVVVRGVALHEGDKVMLSYLSANHDEEVFDNPFDFRVDRSPNDHVAFGGGGPHFCLGASLARMEIRVFFEELLDRVATIELRSHPVRVRTKELNAVKRLMVDLR